MKVEYRILFVLVLSFFIACKPGIQTITVHVTPLSESSLYNPEDIYNYISRYKDSNKVLADKYYKRAQGDLVADPEEATYFYKRSLSLYPNHERYLELGNLLSFQKDYVEMNELYRMLMFRYVNPATKTEEYIFCKPTIINVEDYVVSNVLAYNQIWNNLGEQIALTDSLGYNMNDIKEKVIHDERITLSKPTESNRNILWGLLTNDEKLQYYQDESVPDYYEGHIEDTATIFDIDENSVKQFVYEEYAVSHSNGNFDEDSYMRFNDYLYGNDQDSYNHNYERHLTMNDSISILIYAIDTSAIACPKDMRCIYHRLVTYRAETNHSPKRIIASIIVAEQVGEKLSLFKFNHNKFTITTYKRYWEKPFNKNDFDNHLLNKTEITGQASYQILPDGRIQQLSASAGDKAAS